MSTGFNMSQEKINFRNYILELGDYVCISCKKKITKEEEKNSLARYFAVEHEEFYCAKCAEKRNDYLITRHCR